MVLPIAKTVNMNLDQYQLYPIPSVNTTLIQQTPDNIFQKVLAATSTTSIRNSAGLVYYIHVKFSKTVTVPLDVQSNFRKYFTVYLQHDPKIYYSYFSSLSYFNQTGYGIRFTILSPQTLNLYQV